MQLKETSRIEAFSDGVFAIAITLLVLEISVPQIVAFHTKNDLWRELSHLWPSFFAFLLSFVFILVSWICHHALFNLIDKVSPLFIYTNGFLLLNIVFLPFPTAALARYINSDYTQTAVLFYLLCFFLTGIAWNLLYITSLKPENLVREKGYVKEIESMKRNARYGMIVNVLVTLLAIWFPLTAILINSLLWIFWIRTSAKMLRASKSLHQMRS